MFRFDDGVADVLESTRRVDNFTLPHTARLCLPHPNNVEGSGIVHLTHDSADLRSASLVTLSQMHSAEVVTVTRAWPIGETEADYAKSIPPGDAMVTKSRGIALGILTADCVPVLFADAPAGVIGAAHAGWKGALGGVIEATIAAMEALGARRERISAAIGPCISQANYEVGPEFHARFVGADTSNARFFSAAARASHHQFDLESYVAHQLDRASARDVSRLLACTYAREADFFSFRRATHRGETDYGREISAIVLR